MISIYLTDKSLKVVSAEAERRKTVVTGVYTEYFSDDCISGGNVFDKEVFKSALIALKAKGVLNDKEVTLVLDTPQIITKAITVSAEKENRIYDFIKKEFFDLDEAAEKIFAYSVIYEDQEKKLKRILATTAERTYVEDFIQIFKECGIKLSGLRGTLTTITTLLSKFKFLQDESSIVQVYGNNGVQNILFVDGKYFYSGRTSIFSQHGTEMFGSDGARGVGNIIQFARAQKAADSIFDIFICGINDEDFDILTDAIRVVDDQLGVSRLNDNMKADDFDCDPNYLDEYIFPISGTINGEKTSNFIYYLRKYAKIHSVTEERLKSAAPFIATAVAAVIAICVVAGVDITKNIEKKSLEHFVSSDESARVLQQSEQVASQVTLLAPRNAALSKMGEIIESYPTYNNTVQDAIENCATEGITVKTTSFNATTGELKLDTRVAQISQITPFIVSLKKTGMFKDVDYTGYNFDDKEQNWKINMVCLMEKSAGKAIITDEAASPSPTAKVGLPGVSGGGVNQ